MKASKMQEFFSERVKNIMELFTLNGTYPDFHIFRFLSNYDAKIRNTIEEMIYICTNSTFDNESSYRVLDFTYNFFSRLISDGKWQFENFMQTSKRNGSSSNNSSYSDWYHSNLYFVRTIYHWEVFPANLPQISLPKIPNLKFIFIINNGHLYSDFRSALSKNPNMVLQIDFASIGLPSVQSPSLTFNFEYRLCEKNQDKNTRARGLDKIASMVKEIIDSLNNHNEIKISDAQDLEKELKKIIRKFISKQITDVYIFKDFNRTMSSELENFLKDTINEEFHSNKHKADGTNLTKKFQYREKSIVKRMDAIKIAEEFCEVMIEVISEREIILQDLWTTFLNDQAEKPGSEDYLITLDLIDPGLFQEIAKNEKQIQQWAELYSISPQNITEILQNPTADSGAIKFPVDTVLFESSLKDKLISTSKEKIENIKKNGKNTNDSMIENGLLINSNNFDGLNYLLGSFASKIKCIYIDPPYNTGNESFIFQDKFSRQSWLTMMENRLTLAHKLLSNEGYILISIDYYELNSVLNLMNEIFGESNLIEIFTWTKTLTPPSLSLKSRRDIEYIVCYEKNKTNARYNGPYSDKSDDQPILNTGNPMRKVVFPAGTVSTKLKFSQYKAGQYPKAKLLKDITIRDGAIVEDLEVEIESKWSQQKIDEEVKNGTKFLINSELFSIRFIRKPTIGFNSPKTLIHGKAGEDGLDIGTNETSQKEIKNYGLTFDDYPKPLGLITYLLGFNTKDDDIVLDFFAGSGTTGDAVLELNQTEHREGNRRYILIESEQHFETDLKKRIMKRIYSDKWENGIPKDGKSTTQFVKYISIPNFYERLI